MDFWEQEIDIDDSDLQSLFHPLPIPPPHSSLPSPAISQTLSVSLHPLQPCSQTLNPTPNPNPNPLCKDCSAVHPPIPGPAGAVQAAMHRRSSTAAAAARSPREVISSNFFEQLVEEEDGDFKLNPWLSAMTFVGFSSPLPIGSIKNRRSTTERIPRVAGIVKTCTPNGLGDLNIKLKDPTGTIGASVHRKVLLASNFGGDISVGCALILEKVVVFCPSRSSCYLNVTPNNVVKIFSKDCGPPCKQIISSCAAISEASGKHFEVELAPKDRPLVTRQAETVANNEVRRNLDIGTMMGGRKTGLVGNVPGNIGHTNVTSKMADKTFPRTRESEKLVPGIPFACTDEQVFGIDCEPSRRQMMHSCTATSDASGAGNEFDVELGPKERPMPTCRAETAAGSEVRRNLDIKRMMDGIKTRLAGGLPSSIGDTNGPSSMAEKSCSRTSEPKKLLSEVSVAWTDEEVSQLHFDDDDYV